MGDLIRIPTEGFDFYSFFFSFSFSFFSVFILLIYSFIFLVLIFIALFVCVLGREEESVEARYQKSVSRLLSDRRKSSKTAEKLTGGIGK